MQQNTKKSHHTRPICSVEGCENLVLLKQHRKSGAPVYRTVCRRHRKIRKPECCWLDAGFCPGEWQIPRLTPEERHAAVNEFLDWAIRRHDKVLADLCRVQFLTKVPSDDRHFGGDAHQAIAITWLSEDGLEEKCEDVRLAVVELTRLKTALRVWCGMSPDNKAGD